MRKDKQARHEALVKLISELISDGDPHKAKLFEGHKWAALSQPEWSEALGFSTKTLRTLPCRRPI